MAFRYCFVRIGPSSLCQKLALFVILSQILILLILYYRRLSANIPSHGRRRYQVTHRAPDRITSSLSSNGNTDLQQQGNDYDRSLHRRFLTTKSRLANEPINLQPSIALGLAITTRKAPRSWAKDVTQMPFFHSLLPSFCKTASDGYEYQFFLAYDYDDGYLSKRYFRTNMTITFDNFSSYHCPPSSVYSIHFVECGHTKKPAWAQNDAMIEAYLSGVEYFYRINDDTRMTSRNWTERLIGALDRFIPPRIGVVGPKHRGGNLAILTYDFTHRTHIDIHGFYYPRVFPDWYADRWITSVYKPGRSIKLENVLLVHTMEAGQRYTSATKADTEVNGQIHRDRAKVMRYAMVAETGFRERDPKKVIAMSLYSNGSAHIWGALRNAQLMPIMFPGWSLKIYTSRRSYIPERIILNLERLGAVVVFLESRTTKKIKPSLWSYLAADEDEVEVFLIRRTNNRLNKRDYAVINHWLESKRPEGVIMIKDHPNHANLTLIDGLWGARAERLHSLLGKSSMRNLIEQHTVRSGGNNLELTSILEYIYSKIQNDIVFYDSIMCDKPRSVPFPVLRQSYEYVGQEYNSHEQTRIDDKYNLLRRRNPKCEENI